MYGGGVSSRRGGGDLWPVGDDLPEYRSHLWLVYSVHDVSEVWWQSAQLSLLNLRYIIIVTFSHSMLWFSL